MASDDSVSFGLKMTLKDVVRGTRVPVPWADGEKIPWQDPEFSRRMLKEHLQDDHDAASRRPAKIDAHVSWIHDAILDRQPSRILDLCCGPGLYASRLAALGHRCRGIDFSPASIEYAVENISETPTGSPEYVLGDVRSTDYGTERDLVMMLFGELNVFTRDDALSILTKAYESTCEGGRLLVEVHTFDCLARPGERYWSAAPFGLFSGGSHIHLGESVWMEAASVRCDRHYIIDAETGDVTRHGATTQAYTPGEYDDLLRAAGFHQIEFHPSLVGVNDPSQSYFEVITASRG